MTLTRSSELKRTPMKRKAPKPKKQGEADLRKAARGAECEARLPGVCNGNPETTVLAHLRRCGLAGVGQKPIDICAIPMCSACHDETDRRTRTIQTEELDSYLLDALCRTLDRYAKEGTLRW